MADKSITECPACGSDKIVQEYTVATRETISFRDGSHCDKCGIRFAWNKAKDKEQIDVS